MLNIQFVDNPADKMHIHAAWIKLHIGHMLGFILNGVSAYT